LSSLYFNAQDTVSKIEYLHTAVATFKPDVIGVTESWVNCDTYDDELNWSCYDRPVDSKEGVLFCMSVVNCSLLNFIPGYIS